VIDRVLNSMFHWYRLMGDASEGARVFERDGVVAAVVPAAPERAVMNGVLYRDAAAGFCPPPSGSAFNASNGLRIRWGE